MSLLQPGNVDGLANLRFASNWIASVEGSVGTVLRAKPIAVQRCVDFDGQMSSRIMTRTTSISAKIDKIGKKEAIR